MLVLRLARQGRKKFATYRLVAADSRRAVTGKFIANLGHYNPHTKEAVLDIEKIKSYVKNGAQPSGTVVKLLKKEKVKLPKWAEANLKIKSKSPKKTAEENPAEIKEAAKPSEIEKAKEAETPVEAKAGETPVEAKAESAQQG